MFRTRYRGTDNLIATKSVMYLLRLIFSASARHITKSTGWKYPLKENIYIFLKHSSCLANHVGLKINFVEYSLNSKIYFVDIQLFQMEHWSLWKANAAFASNRWKFWGCVSSTVFMNHCWGTTFANPSSASFFNNQAISWLNELVLLLFSGRN